MNQPLKEETSLPAPLLELLVCPLTGGALTYDKTTQELISKKALLAYPIRENVPIMVASQARPLSLDAPKAEEIFKAHSAKG